MVTGSGDGWGNCPSTGCRDKTELLEITENIYLVKAPVIKCT